jgi:hypothetical protein
VRASAREPVREFRLAVTLRKNGLRLIDLLDGDRPQDLPAGAFRSEVSVPPMFLSPGEYFVSVGGYSVHSRQWLWAVDIASFVITDEATDAFDGSNMGLVHLMDCGRRVSGEQR